MKFFNRTCGRCILTKTPVSRYYVTAREMKDVMSHLQGQGTYFVGGSNSIYIPKGKIKYLDKSACRPWPNLENEVGSLSPAEAARIELMRAWPELKRVGWSPKQVSLLDLRSPLYYTGPRIGPMTYIDLDAAYSQIYARLWLDTTYPRAYYGQYPLWGVANRLSIWKAARNSLIGICRSRDAIAYRGTKRITIKVKNRYLSPGLWATVQRVLHWVAAEAIGRGAIYVNVDGYIFPGVADNFCIEFMERLSELGLRWSIRSEGEGEIVAWNNYRIGFTKTKSYRLGLMHNSKEFSNVDFTDEEEWERYWAGCGRIYRDATGN